MGVYFMYVNFTKRQFLDTWAFNQGPKAIAYATVGSEGTNAALTLMADEWRGDLVALVGDEVSRSFYEEATHLPQAKTIIEICDSDSNPYDYADEWFEDVSTSFKCAKGKIGYVRVGMGPDAEWVEQPLEGSFEKDIVEYPYVVNETTKEFYKRADGVTLTPPVPS